MDSSLKKTEKSFLNNQAQRRLSYDECSPRFNRSDYSLRRYFVDEFYMRQIRQIPNATAVLDIGGKKANKRGQFDINNHKRNVIYVNIDQSSSPDILGNASALPISNNSMDTVICSELLEHVPDPKAILLEAWRVLKKDGTLLVTTPFLFRIHSDPFDYSRYTDHFLGNILSEIGFQNIKIEKMGYFFSVLADMFRGLVNQLIDDQKLRNLLFMKIAIRFISWAKKKALRMDRKPYFYESKYFKSYTTGFGITAQKK